MKRNRFPSSQLHLHSSALFQTCLILAPVTCSPPGVPRSSLTSLSPPSPNAAPWRGGKPLPKRPQHRQTVHLHRAAVTNRARRSYRPSVTETLKTPRGASVFGLCISELGTRSGAKHAGCPPGQSPPLPPLAQLCKKRCPAHTGGTRLFSDATSLLPLPQLWANNARVYVGISKGNNWSHYSTSGNICSLKKKFKKKLHSARKSSSLLWQTHSAH